MSDVIPRSPASETEELTRYVNRDRIYLNSNETLTGDRLSQPYSLIVACAVLVSSDSGATTIDR